ncbi:hypothetical protein ABENE_03500 [Asticcacaulis benevestitus DSM 16100 = ATCC BAA-896]|uniref:Uncharacterized protein n=1 Tax=Asticcacaulis benevestitus DSM 16100 = ATCC BAA-896 TaxID=1121022 RepID=V4Q3A8_9CAUL|nr:hypothetical protein ABENE_03500 [Asticcacaulis benevestitus DSM 16100 = ATCC BAA-896]
MAKFDLYAAMYGFNPISVSFWCQFSPKRIKKCIFHAEIVFGCYAKRVRKVKKLCTKVSVELIDCSLDGHERAIT